MIPNALSNNPLNPPDGVLPPVDGVLDDPLPTVPKQSSKFHVVIGSVSVFQVVVGHESAINAKKAEP